MSLETPVKSLIGKQQALLEILSDAYIKSTKTNSSCFEMRNEALEALYEKFQEQHDKIEMSIEEDEKGQLTYFTEDLCQKFQGMYIKYKAKTREHNTALVPKSSTSSVPREMLPEIPLPRFSGGYENWLSFRSMFKSLIHDNYNLSSYEKIYYLKSCLQGAAKNELKYISTIGYNYEDAWKRINERYNNRQRNTNEVLKRLFALKPMRQDSSKDINQLLITTIGCLASLETLEVDVSSWDPIINYIVESKLDQESHLKWVSEVVKLGADELPTWEQLKAFLQNRFHFLEIIEMSNIGRQNN